jgi:hypothetical protein
MALLAEFYVYRDQFKTRIGEMGHVAPS